MPFFAFEGRSPQVHPEAWVAPTATVIGDVVVEAGASIWYGVVLRGDLGRIVVRTGADVLDNSVLHGGHDPETDAGRAARVRGPLSAAAAGWVAANPSIYRELARRHAAGIEVVSAPDGCG